MKQMRHKPFPDNVGLGRTALISAIVDDSDAEKLPFASGSSGSTTVVRPPPVTGGQESTIESPNGLPLSYHSRRGVDCAHAGDPWTR
jgi:hypothetical protein